MIELTVHNVGGAAGTDCRVIVNPAHVVRIRPQHDGATAVLVLSDGEQVRCTESYEDVVRALQLGGHVVRPVDPRPR